MHILSHRTHRQLGSDGSPDFAFREDHRKPKAGAVSLFLFDDPFIAMIPKTCAEPLAKSRVKLAETRTLRISVAQPGDAGSSAERTVARLCAGDGRSPTWPASGSIEISAECRRKRWEL